MTEVTTLTAVELLKTARDKLVRVGWTKNVNARLKDPSVAGGWGTGPLALTRPEEEIAGYCMMGACRSASIDLTGMDLGAWLRSAEDERRTEFTRAIMALRDTINPDVPQAERLTVSGYNDSVARTRTEVLDIFDRTITRLGGA